MTNLQILIALGLLLANGIITFVAVLTFTRGLATKDDINRLDRRFENLEQRIDRHLEGHP
ncbi:hypothetical protein C6502_19435 [Candidatus Poribacteria bacterium]|nr:MAG: hypothetical protein C6502_19435 [Candidatus Poribacteria bacterium]